MAEIFNQQIYDLLLAISHEVTELDASIDELLVEKERSTDRQL